MKQLFLALLLLAAPLRADWTLAQFNAAAKASGRKMPMDQDAFDKLQAAKAKMLRRIERYLKAQFGSADPEVLRGFKELPREYFQYHYKDKVSLAKAAYESSAKPYAIGYGSALSDYLGQAYMTQLLELKKDQVALEIGTGSGYQISLLSRIGREVYSIEIQKKIGSAVAKLFAPLGYTNIHTKVADGFYGWPAKDGGPAGGFDRIIVTCAASYVPPELIAQLKPNGIMVIPIGQPFKRGQLLYLYSKDAEGKVHSKRLQPVYFVPMTGDISKQRN